MAILGVSANHNPYGVPVNHILDYMEQDLLSVFIKIFRKALSGESSIIDPVNFEKMTGIHIEIELDCDHSNSIFYDGYQMRVTKNSVIDTLNEALHILFTRVKEDTNILMVQSFQSVLHIDCLCGDHIIWMNINEDALFIEDENPRWQVKSLNEMGKTLS